LLSLTLKLSKKELELYQQGLDEISYKSDSGLIQELESIYDDAADLCERKKKESSESIEKSLYLFIDDKEMLCYFYNKALAEDNPQILLNAFYTTNHIKSTFSMSSGYDHCDKLRKVLLCYAGNNYSLIDRYWPSNIGESSDGNRCLVAATNLILAIRGDLDKSEIRAKSELFLAKKNRKSDIAIISALLAILNEDSKAISENLDLVAKAFKSMKWLHSMSNPISKYLPFISYALVSIIHRHLGTEQLKEIVLPDTNIWWQSYYSFNEINDFAEGGPVLDFQGRLSCINNI